MFSIIKNTWVCKKWLQIQLTRIGGVNMFDKIIDLADRFGAIDAVRDALLKQPNLAAAKLAEVLDELAKTVTALDDELVRYLSLYFHTEESIAHGRGVLLGMEVGQSAIRINEARGHCHKIKNIYDKYLNTWFDNVFQPNSPENVALIDAFGSLTTADDYIVEAMMEASNWLKVQAEKTLDAVDTKNLIGANTFIQQARREVKPARERLTETMSKLRAMQADFIYASGSV